MKRSNHWVWLRNTFAVTAVVVLIGFAAAPRVVRAACTGDCGNTGTVTVTDIVTMVHIALGTAQLSTCTNGDANGDGQITVDEILQAVNNALVGCPAVPTPTPTVSVPAFCGDGLVNAEGEECDDGGTCIGGSNAGTHCTSEADCGLDQDGVCLGGNKAKTRCDPTVADACPASSCKRCIAQGGDGCAANCTTETTVLMPLVPGVNPDNTSLKPGTSGSIVFNGVLGPLGLAMSGSQTLAIGKERVDPDTNQHQIPVVVNAVHINQINLADISCVCVRGAPDKTCGGVLIEADGTTIATDCTPKYIGGTCKDEDLRTCTSSPDCTDARDIGCVGGVCADCRLDSECDSGECVMHACDGKSKCAFVHGLGGTCSVTTTKTCRQASTDPANQCPSGETCVEGGVMSSGVISCDTGLKGTNMLMTEDSRRADGQEDPPWCNYDNPDTFVSGSTFPECAANPVIKLTDQPSAPVGAALVLNSTAIGQYTGSCDEGDPNRPANFCTDLEGYSTRGLPNTLPAVTNKACSEMTNIFLFINGVGDITTDLALCDCDNNGFSCTVPHCRGPHCFTGSPLPSCSQLTANPPNVSGLGLAGAFTSPAQATISDIAVTDVLQAQ